jgi:diacylglycerol kinase (ATP)
VLQIGSLASLGVSFLLSVALARVLGRDGYGAYALVISTMTTISLFKRLGQDYIVTTRLAAAYARYDSLEIRAALTTFNSINLWSTLLVIPPALVLAPLICGYFYGDAALGDPLRLALLPPIWAMTLATLVVVLQCSRRMVALTLVENANNLGLALGGVALALAAAVRLSRVEWAVLVLVIALVLILEAVNTALEALVDLATAEYHPLAKQAKDLAAGAVWLASLAALAVGALLFGPRLWALATGR